MDIPLAPPLRVATPNDARRLGDITGEAFADDPVNRHVFGNPRAILSVMRVVSRDIYLKRGWCILHEAGGAAMWARPGEDPDFSGLAMLRIALGQMRHGAPGAMKRATLLGDLMAQHHPKAPHIYLFTLGTTKAARGKGVGKALLAPVLAACDREGVPAYLENTNPANHGFYTSHGFEQTGAFTVGDDGPPVAPMWREPRSA